MNSFYMIIFKLMKYKKKLNLRGCIKRECWSTVSLKMKQMRVVICILYCEMKERVT